MICQCVYIIYSNCSHQKFCLETSSKLSLLFPYSLSLANSFLSSMSKAAAQFPFKLFLHKICISFTTHTFLKWNHVKNCPLCGVCVILSKVRILLFEAKQKVIPSDSSRQMGPRPRPYTYFQQIYNLSILGNPGCS